jgi:hypothetical protein
MIFKNINTAKVIEEDELSYFNNLKLETAFITRGWIAQYIEEGAIECEIINQLNASSLNRFPYTNPKRQILICNIEFLDKILVYRVPLESFIIDLYYHVELETLLQNKSNSLNSKKDDLAGMVHVQLLSNSKIVIDLNMKSITLASSNWFDT